MRCLPTLSCALPRLAVAALALLVVACSTFDKDPSAKWDADRLLTEARGEMAVSSWKKAREYLEKLEARFPFTRHAQQAQMEIAYTFYKEGEPAQAITAADRFLKLNPNHPNADYVYYLKGLAAFSDDLGLFGRAVGQDPSTRDPKAMREAFDVFRELTSRYPDSKYAADARARMNWLVNALAQSEVNIARFYYLRGAYVAAIQRAQGALREFNGAPAAEDALGIIVLSYRGLGMDDMQADAARVLAKNFPASRFLAPNAKL